MPTTTFRVRRLDPIAPTLRFTPSPLFVLSHQNPGAHDCALSRVTGDWPLAFLAALGVLRWRLLRVALNRAAVRPPGGLSMPSQGPCDYKEWMKGLMEAFPEFGSRRIHQMVLPSTHNSAANRVDRRSLPSVLGGSYAICQDVGVGQQLDMGVRFLDIRVCNDTGDGELWVSHTFPCQQLAPVLSEVRGFLEATSAEIVVLQLVKDYNRGLSDDGCLNLASIVLDMLSKYLIADAGQSAACLVEAGQRLLVTSTLPCLQQHPIGARPLADSWPVTHADSTSALIKRLEAYICTQRPPQCVHALGCYITPTALSICKWVATFQSWHSVEKGTNNGVVGMLHNLPLECSSFLNIVDLDRVDPDVVGNVISLNTGHSSALMG
eukprot:evm.model.scf_531.8 EVM.evm.TU.scf_531.8   scf_531:58106-59242(+)